MAIAIASTVISGKETKAKIKVIFNDAQKTGSWKAVTKFASPIVLGIFKPSKRVNAKNKLARIGRSKKDKKPISQGAKKIITELNNTKIIS